MLSTFPAAPAPYHLNDSPAREYPNEYSHLSNNSNNLESASKLSSQTFFTTSINEENSLNEKRFADYLAENGAEQQKHSKVVGGVKVFPTVPHDHKQAALIRQNMVGSSDQHNEYNFIDYSVSERTLSKEVRYMFVLSSVRQKSEQLFLVVQ